MKQGKLPPVQVYMCSMAESKPDCSELSFSVCAVIVFDKLFQYLSTHTFFLWTLLMMCMPIQR